LVWIVLDFKLDTIAYRPTCLDLTFTDSTDCVCSLHFCSNDWGAPFFPLSCIARHNFFRLPLSTFPSVGAFSCIYWTASKVPYASQSKVQVKLKNNNDKPTYSNNFFSPS
jgi:hypothetical protein